MERATIKRAKSRINGSVRLASVLLSPLNHAITAERCLASPLGFQTSPIAPVGGPKCQEWVMGGKTPSEYMLSELPQVGTLSGARFII
jgi:hypothetical protein